MDWYPRDYFADRKVRAFTTGEEHGIYLVLLFTEWTDGPLPKDLDELADIVPGGRAAIDRVWPKVGRCFETRNGHLVNGRLERERSVALAARRRMSEAGKVGNAKRWGKDGEDIGGRSPPDRDPIAQHQRVRSPASASASATAPKEHSLRSLSNRLDADPTAIEPAEVEDQLALVPGATTKAITPAALADLWTETNATLPQPRRPIDGKIKTTLTTAIKRERGRDWRATFERIAKSDTLNGRGTLDWSCPSIVWALGPKNLEKIDTGHFDNRTNTPRSRSGFTAERNAELDAMEKRVAAEMEAQKNGAEIHSEPTPW
jgi:uncharacterized protein YdaU (DUF1376 family)